MADDRGRGTSEAGRLAEEFGVDPEQVQAILESIAEIQHYFLRRPAVELRLALSSSDPSTVVAELLREDVGIVSVRVAWFHCLANPFSPLYTRDELADLLLRMRKHLKRNQQSLTATGHPDACFRASPWLDWLLGRLYYVKRPVVVDRSRPGFEALASFPLAPQAEDGFGNTAYVYMWTEQRARPPFREAPAGPLGVERRVVPQTAFEFRDSLPVDDRGVPVKRCDYSEAGLMRGMDPETVVRLDSIRGKFLQLELDAIGRLTAALRDADASELWEDCAQAITASLTLSEAELLINTDRLYGGSASLNTERFSTSVPLLYENNGGLTGLLSLIGHVEKEITIGTMHETRLQLSGAEDALSLGSYYEAIGRPYQRTLDKAIATLFIHSAREDEFWAEYAQRTSEHLDRKLDVEVQVSVRMPREHATRAHRELRGIADIMSAQVATYGTLPGIPQITLAVSGAERGPGEGRVQDVAPFPTPAGVGWEQVALVFYNDETVRITAGAFSDHKTFEDMGFVDRRFTPPRPDRLWIFLRSLAKQEGEFGAVGVPQVSWGKTRRMVSDLRSRLKHYFSIEEDPFHPYVSARLYRTRFVLRWDDGYRRAQQNL